MSAVLFGMSSGNALIDALPAATQDAVMPLLARVLASRGKVTIRAGEAIQYVHFPIDAVVAIVVEGPGGRSVEVTVVGNNGFVEIDAPLESRLARRSAICRVQGSMWRMSLADFRTLLATEPAFLSAIRRATRARIAATEQLVLCNVHHTIDQRLARWLLAAQADSGRDRLRITQAELATALGVRRAGVSIAISRLREKGAASNEHGVIIVTDRARLAAIACDCYQIMRGCQDLDAGETMRWRQ